MKKPLTVTDLAPARGARRVRTRVGRGLGSGLGKTSGRGHKGSGARSGYSKPLSFEGGQMPMFRRTPKSGFTPRARLEYQPVNVGLLERFAAGATVDPAAMKAKGLVDGRKPVKILGDGKLTKKLALKAHACSQAARKAIEAAGGTIEINPKSEILNPKEIRSSKKQ